MATGGELDISKFSSIAFVALPTLAPPPNINSDKSAFFVFFFLEKEICFTSETNFHKQKFVLVFPTKRKVYFTDLQIYKMQMYYTIPRHYTM